MVSPAWDQHPELIGHRDRRLLPIAQALTEQNAQRLDSTYRSQHSGVLTARLAFGVGGALLLAALIGLQVDYARRFHRMIAPSLLTATALIAVGIISTVAMLGHQAEHLRVAKRDAFDSMLALSRARAVSYDANADESRYLVDPRNASPYQQTFLQKSQQLVSLPGASIVTWDERFARAIQRYRADPNDVGWGGFLGQRRTWLVSTKPGSGQPIKSDNSASVSPAPWLTAPGWPGQVGPASRRLRRRSGLGRPPWPAPRAGRTRWW